MKFRLHVFEKVRHAFVVEADSAEQAYDMVEDCIFDEEPESSEFTGEYDVDVCVDPLLPNGEVDFDNYEWFPKEKKE